MDSNIQQKVAEVSNFPLTTDCTLINSAYWSRWHQKTIPEQGGRCKEVQSGRSLSNSGLYFPTYSCFNFEFFVQFLMRRKKVSNSAVTLQRRPRVRNSRLPQLQRTVNCNDLEVFRRQ